MAAGVVETDGLSLRKVQAVPDFGAGMRQQTGSRAGETTEVEGLAAPDSAWLMSRAISHAVT